MGNIKEGINTENREERASNLELLRIIAALFVIIVHYNNTGSGKAFLYTEDMPTHYQILLLLEMAAICAVNIFVMISGYFLCTSKCVKIWKVIRLYIDVIFFSVLRYFLYCLLGEETFSISGFLERFIPLNWYVAVYSGLYLLHPYINQMIQGKDRRQFRFMLMVFGFVLSIWPSGMEFISKALDFSPKSLSPISNQGSGDGYTLANFVLMYLFGAYCRIHISKEISAKNRIVAANIYAICVILNTFYAKFFFGRAASYCNPLVIIQTIAIFVFFMNISLKSKVINWVASGSFAVFLMHSFFFPYCQIERFVTGNPFAIPVHIFITTIFIYAISTMINWGYQKIFGPLFKLGQMKLSFLTYDVSESQCNKNGNSL